MELKERLIVNYNDVSDVIRNVLDEMRDLRSDSFVRRILSSKDLDAVREWENLLQKRLEEPFSLVVMGDFKRGKSTLINAILGKKLAPTNVTPETVTINRILYGEESSREAVLRNGMRIHLEEPELGRAELEKIMERLPSPIDYINIQEPNEVLREISIVDTPGMGDIMGEFDEQVYSYIGQADAVIYVASALSPLSESEQVFLSTMLRPQSFSRLFLIINMADCLDSEKDIKRVKALILDRARAVSMNASVFAISSLDEFCRKTGKKRPNMDLAPMLETAFQAFNTALQEDILLQKEAIRAERLVKLGRNMVQDTRRRIELIGNMLGVKRSELKEMEEKCHADMVNIDSRLQKSCDELDMLSIQLSRQAREWMAEFLERMKREVASIGNSQSTVTLQKHLQFYLSDSIKQGILACIGIHRTMMEAKMKECAEEFTKESLQLLPEQRLGEIHVQLADISWTTVDTAAYAINTGAEVLLGTESEVYTLVSLVTNVVGGFCRENKKKTSQQEILNPLLKNFSDLEDKVLEQVDAAYKQMKQASCKQLEELFEAQLDISLTSLNQAQKVLQEEEFKEEDLKDKLRVAFENLNRVDALLDGTGIDLLVTNQE